MARRRRQRRSSYMDDLPIGAFVLILFAAIPSIISKYWYLLLGLIVALVVVVSFILVRKHKKKKTKIFLMNEIDSLDGIAFEEYMADMLRRMGYKSVTVTKASGDFGVDITAKLNNELWVFQCKRYTGNLGVKPVQEVFAGAAKYHADKAVVVTNSFFTVAAQELAGDTNVMLWDRDRLSKILESINSTVKTPNNVNK